MNEAMLGRMRRPLLPPFGILPRMTPEQQAKGNSELGHISSKREMVPVLDGLKTPVRFVLASGASFGSHCDEQERCPVAIESAAARNADIRNSAKVASNHDWILRKDSATVVKTIREIRPLGWMDHESSRIALSPYEEI